MIKAPEDIVIIKVEKKTEPEKNSSGLLIAMTFDEEPKNVGIVYAVGEGRMLKSGVRVPMDVKVGDKIMFNPGGTMKFKHDNEDYLSMFTSAILAILEGEEEV